MNGLTIKEFTEDTITVGGYGVIFGGHDLEGDTFTKDTDFMFDYAPNKIGLWSHNKDTTVKGKIGQVTNYYVDEVGVWFDMQLQQSNKYIGAIKRLIDQGVLGYSTGAFPQLIKREGGVIKSWPILEVSITPNPAEPRTLGVDFVKDIDEIDQLISEIQPSDETEVVAESEPVSSESDNEKVDQVDSNIDLPIAEKQINFHLEKDRKKMSENVTFEEKVNEFMKTYQAEKVETDKNQKSVSDQLSLLLDAVQGSNKAMGAGFVSQDGGTADKSVKSFTDFLVAVKRGDQKRLGGIYGSVKDMSADVGAQGAYLVPPEYETNLLQLAQVNNAVMSKVRVVPVSSDSGRYPVLDQYITPSAAVGETAYAAGVKTYPAEAGATLQKTEPKFNMLDWRLHKIGGYTEVDNELIEDSPISIEALLTSLFSIAVGAKTERNILRGSGVGEPLGILNSNAVITQTAANAGTFAWADVAGMWSKFKSAGGTPNWLLHPGVWPDVLSMAIGSSQNAVWTANMQGGQGSNLNGYGILTSEHLPVADSAGSALLADFSAYLLFQKRGISIAFSEHAAFTSDQGTWRFTQRMDGMPWLRAPITLADGTYKVSPFVSHSG